MEDSTHSLEGGEREREGEEGEELVLEKQKLGNYFRMCLSSLSHHYTGLDTSKLTVVYFAALGLSIIDMPLTGKEKEDVVEYIYSLQVFFGGENLSCSLRDQAGFLGSSYLGLPNESCGYDLARHSTCSNVPCHCTQSTPYLGHVQGHIAMTYCGVLTLYSLGDDLGRIDKESIVHGLRQLQHTSGAFQATRIKSECDMRFLYCACAISATLGDWRGVDIDLAEKYIMDCYAYEGGISLVPGNEAHGGSTYTAIASLVLMNRLDNLGPKRRANLIRWCLMRQSDGYNGRTNKDNDSCYSFWIGATLHLLGEFHMTHITSTRQFLLGNCQHSILGGFSKSPGAPPDILHTFYSLCWLSMSQERGTSLIDCRLGMRADKCKGILNMGQL